MDGSISEDVDRNSVGEDFEGGTKRLASRMERKLPAQLMRDEGSWQSPGLEPLWGGREFIDLLSQGWDPRLGEKSPLQAEEQSQVSFHCSRLNGPAGEMVQKRRRKALQKPLSKGTRGAGCR